MRTRHWLAVWAALLCGGPAARAGDADAIAQQMKHDFEHPGQPLAVSPVVVDGEWAVAGWTQGDMGGRALLRLRDGAWVIWLCAGDGIRSARALRETGLPAPVADRLASGLAAAEAKEDPARVALFSRFEGVVPMGAATR